MNEYTVFYNRHVLVIQRPVASDLYRFFIDEDMIPFLKEKHWTFQGRYVTSGGKSITRISLARFVAETKYPGTVYRVWQTESMDYQYKSLKINGKIGEIAKKL